MANLHLVSQLKVESGLDKWLNRLVDDTDEILFISDAVVSLLDAKCEQLLNTVENPIYALEADVKCRGIINKLPNFVKVVDDKTMVDLAAHSQQVISW